MFNIEASFAQMANLAAQLSFWGVPGVVTVAYAVMRWEQTRIVIEGGVSGQKERGECRALAFHREK